MCNIHMHTCIGSIRTDYESIYCPNCQIAPQMQIHIPPVIFILFVRILHVIWLTDDFPIYSIYPYLNYQSKREYYFNKHDTLLGFFS